MMEVGDGDVMVAMMIVMMVMVKLLQQLAVGKRTIHELYGGILFLQ